MFRVEGSGFRDRTDFTGANRSVGRRFSRAPTLGQGPYRPAVSWGQTAYFDLNVETLKRMAASRKLELDVRAADGSTLSFSPTVDTRGVLKQYMQDRGITGD